jgi:hypothetical protein
VSAGPSTRSLRRASTTPGRGNPSRLGPADEPHQALGRDRP